MIEWDAKMAFYGALHAKAERIEDRTWHRSRSREFTNLALAAMVRGSW
jgi:hypothetical protein